MIIDLKPVIRQCRIEMVVYYLTIILCYTLSFMVYHLANNHNMWIVLCVWLVYAVVYLNILRGVVRLYRITKHQLAVCKFVYKVGHVIQIPNTIIGE